MTAQLVAVTGADGFIGSHLAELLVEQGFRVRAMVQYNSIGSFGWLDSLAPTVLDHLEVVASDVRDSGATHSFVRGAHTVFHLAALIGIPYSYVAPRSYIAVNVEGTLNVLEAALRHDARVIQTSTSETYGTAVTIPMNEEHRLNAQSPYAASKIGADQLALSYARSFNLPVVVLRPFNTFGPRQSTRAIISSIITQLAAGSPTLRIGALEPTRDFTFVRDTASAFLSVSQSTATNGEVINCGTGSEISIGDLATLIGKIMGREFELAREPERIRPDASEVRRLVADTSKIRRLTDWQPRYDLRAGLEETIQWFADPENLARYRVGTMTV